MFSKKPRLGFITLVAGLALHANAQRVDVSETPAPNTFPLVDKTAAAIAYDAGDAKVVDIAAHLLAEDIKRVTGLNPSVSDQAPDGRKPLVLIGTIGKSRAIDFLIKSGKLDVSKIQGKWESYVIAAVTKPVKGIDDALVIVGSDPRGTAYGVFTLSESIGVSPWYFWADVPPKKKTQVYVGRTPLVQGPPAVKYRGIFLNDEDWGLEPWAAETFEPETGTIGPKTYARIFELLLRLRANTVWPAMHACTKAFFTVPGNAEVADQYDIVIGSSHAEPMLRNNVDEWKADKSHYNFLEYRSEVLDYWRERVEERTSGESLFTIGMRGVHDSPIVGPKTQKERISTLEKIFAAQREMLASILGNGDPTRVAQIFCPYKEVLADYLAGLEVPDDVTIVWPDDNFGYVRRYATPAERKRSGGLGVYYHLSYLGNPLAWTWVDTLPPALPWSEMTRAYEQGARTVWIANAGDLKNNERSIEFFLNLAWNADRTDPAAPARFMHAAAVRDFGPEYADAIVDILTRLQSINFERKVEHLQWFYSLTPYKPTECNEAEIRNRLEACAVLLKDSDALAERLPKDLRDAYFELIGYPAGITEAANERYFRSELARADEARGRSPHDNRDAVQAAEKRIQELTQRYNDKVAGGKWKNIVTENGISSRDWIRFQPEANAKKPDPAPGNVCPPAPPKPAPLPHPEGARSGDFVERDGVVSMYAGHFNERRDVPSGAGWQSIPGLGRTGSAVTVRPSTAVIEPGEAPTLGYRFHVSKGAPATLHVRLLPTHPLVSGQGLCLAVALDDGAAIPLAVTDGFNSKEEAWKQRVLANAVEVSAEVPGGLEAGWHTLQLIAVDAGVVVDKVVIDLGGIQPSYDGPGETRLP